jgi:hypothetical protein
MQTFAVNLADLQPSQLYISAEKLARAERAMRDAGTGPEPLPVRQFGPRTVLTDGHTRALAAHRAGATSIAVYAETDELDWEAYEICVQWCLEEGIRSIADLEAKIVPPDRYEVLWYARCRALHEQLARQRAAGS